jgi:hypothetical protein
LSYPLTLVGRPEGWRPAGSWGRIALACSADPTAASASGGCLSSAMLGAGVGILMMGVLMGAIALVLLRLR